MPEPTLSLNLQEPDSTRSSPEVLPPKAKATSKTKTALEPPARPQEARELQQPQETQDLQDPEPDQAQEQEQVLLDA